MKPALHVAILRATGHGGRTLLHTLAGATLPPRDVQADVETDTRSYRFTVGMPRNARADELPVHGAIVLVRVADGVVEGTHRALRHAHVRGVRHILIVLNLHGATRRHDPDAVERDARMALFHHRFDGDSAPTVQGFDRVAIFAQLEAHIPFFELGQEMLPRLITMLRMCEHGPQLIDELGDNHPDARPLPRLLAALMDHGFATLDADLFLALTPLGRDALDDPPLLATAANQASRARMVGVGLGDEYGGRVAVRRGNDDRTVLYFGDRGPADRALARLLLALPLSTRSQDALEALRAGVVDHAADGTWAEVAPTGDLAAAFAEIDALVPRAQWLFDAMEGAWTTLRPLADWFGGAVPSPAVRAQREAGQGQGWGRFSGERGRVFLRIQQPQEYWDDY